MKRLAIILVLAATAVSADQVTGSHKHKNHEAGCLAGTIGGALLGGLIGNQFGAGDGKTLLTATGAVIGGVAASKSHACK